MRTQASILMAIALAVGLISGTAQGTDNQGSGGVITFTDANGSNAAASIASLSNDTTTSGPFRRFPSSMICSQSVIGTRRFMPKSVTHAETGRQV